jgi:tRNA (adenine37-N6)-methyltransferase
MESICCRPIGLVHSPFTDVEGMPIQPGGRAADPGTVEIFPEFAEGLCDLEGFSHLILLVHLHQAGTARLSVTPFLDSEPRGVFATRAPTRPSPIGLSVVEVVRREGPVLHIANLDFLDGTPVLDVKPYVPSFDSVPGARAGWLEGVSDQMAGTRADSRFRPGRP